MRRNATGWVALAVVLSVGAVACTGPPPKAAARSPGPSPSPSSAPPVVRTVSGDYIAVVSPPSGASLHTYQSADAPSRDRNYVVGPRYYALLDQVAVAQQFNLGESPGAYFDPVRGSATPTPAPNGTTKSTVLQAADGYELVAAHVA